MELDVKRRTPHMPATRHDGQRCLHQQLTADTWRSFS